MRYAITALIGYLLGGFPTGVVLSRRKYGLDVREMGSGNIGATNITRNFGWYAGVLVFVIDFLKGFLPLIFVWRYSPDDPWLLTTLGTSLVLGHCYSAYLRLGGGKGVATSLGALLALAPWAAVAAAGVYVTLLLITRISAIGSLSGILATLIYLGVADPEAPVAVLILSIAAIVVLRHQSNIRRLWNDWKTRKK